MDRDRDLHFILLVIMANLLILQTEFIAIHMSFIIFQLILCLSQHRSKRTIIQLSLIHI